MLKQLNKKTKAIIIIAIIIVIATIAAIVVNNLSNDNNKDSYEAAATQTAQPTKRPIALPTHNTETTEEAATVSAAATEEITQTASPAETTAPTAAPTDSADVNEMVDESNTEAGIDALQMKEDTLKNQDTFDSYISNKDYDSAKKLLDDFFKDNSYANNSLATYKNYVTYYESQGLYNDSAIYQLDYIEKNDGLDNVREGSTHYQLLTATLQNIPDFSDSRLDTIEASVKCWKELEDLYTANNDDEVISRTKDMIKNGKETVTAYLYLVQSLRSKGDSLEEAKVYYCYLAKDYTSLNQLEQSYYSMFSNALNMLYYNDKITSDDVEYLEDEFDYNNYLK